MSAGSTPDDPGTDLDLDLDSWESFGFGDDTSFDVDGTLAPAGRDLPMRWDALTPGDVDDVDDVDDLEGVDDLDDLDQLPPLEFGVPDASAPPLTATVFEPLDLGDGGTSLYDDAYRVSFRLTGVRPLAHELAALAIREGNTSGGSDGVVGAVMVAAVNGSARAAVPDDVPYAQHRARLRRDLLRYSPRDQAILALRHLVGVPPVAVAARLGIHESVVREVASHWWPEDGRGDSSALLRGIDSWIHGEDPGTETAPGNEHLAHLDDARLR